MKANIDNIRLCNIHTYHLFEDPLCKDQSLLRKIFNVVFHILTLGLPLIIYSIIACCSKPVIRAKPPSVSTPLIDPEIPSLPFGIDPDVDISEETYVETGGISAELRQELLDFVNRKIELYPDIVSLESYDWSKEFYNGPCEDAQDVIHRPRNKNIDKLMALYRGPLLDNLKTALNNHHSSDMSKNIYEIWKQKDVLKAGDDLLKVGMAIYLLTVEDFEGVAHPDTGESLKKVIENGTCYQNRTLYCLWDTYSLLRIGCRYHNEKQKWVFAEDDMSNTVRESISNSFIDRVKVSGNLFFGVDGHYLANWKHMYNDCCRHFQEWISQDTSKGRYDTGDYIPPLDSDLDYYAKGDQFSFINTMIFKHGT